MYIFPQPYMFDFFEERYTIYTWIGKAQGFVIPVSRKWNRLRWRYPIYGCLPTSEDAGLKEPRKVAQK